MEYTVARIPLIRELESTLPGPIFSSLWLTTIQRHEWCGVLKHADNMLHELRQTQPRVGSNATNNEFGRPIR